MPLGHEPVAQFLVIINLSIEDNPDGFVFIAHGLRACAKIDNGQAKMAQTGIAIQMYSLAVRTAVRNGIKHRLNIGPLHPDIRGED